jgi:HD-like signal output (HDOD) protein
VKRRVLFAAPDTDEGAILSHNLKTSFDVSTVASPEQFPVRLDDIDLLLLDHKFTDQWGMDFMPDILARSYLPVLVLTPPDNARCAVDAIKAGAYNYIVKFGEFQELLDVSINEAIIKFGQIEQMRQTIISLKERVVELEKGLGPTPPEKEAADEAQSQPEKKSTIIGEIAVRLKQGEINLPSIPEIVVKFRQLLDEGADYRQIADLLKQDVAISSKLISVSNSALYRGMSPNNNLEQCIARLGMKTIQQYVNVISNRSLYTVRQKKYLPFIERLWQHSLACAYASQTTVQMLGMESHNDPFTLGLFHDLGKLVLLQIIAELGTKGNMSDGIGDEEFLNTIQTNHCQFGAVLLKRWSFPDVYAAIALHHHDLWGVEKVTDDLLIVHFADTLVNEAGYRFIRDAAPSPLMSAESTRLLGIKEETTDEIKATVFELMDEMEQLFR